MVLKLMGSGRVRGTIATHGLIIKHFGIKCVILGFYIITLQLNNLLLKDSSYLSNLL